MLEKRTDEPRWFRQVLFSFVPVKLELSFLCLVNKVIKVKVGQASLFAC